jgi:8-oxo-dGTP diphosphatase
MNDAYPKPSLTVDVVLLRWHGGRLECLLIQRGHPPFEGHWALPGGFVDANEAPRDAALRELVEETHVGAVPLFELGAFGAPGRDPRGWVVSAAYLGLAPPDVFAKAGDDAREVRWAPLSDLPPMAFDHGEIITAARRCLAGLTQTSTDPLRLLPSAFRTKQARHLYSQILGVPVAPRPFKAWLRRRAVVDRVGPARFARRLSLRPDWLR